MWDPSRFRSGKTARKGKVPGNYAKNLSDKGSEYHRKSPGLSGLVWHTRACPRRPGKGNHREVKPTWGPLPHSANGCSPGGSQPVRSVWSLRGWRWDAASLLPSPDEVKAYRATAERGHRDRRARERLLLPPQDASEEFQAEGDYAPPARSPHQRARRGRVSTCRWASSDDTPPAPRSSTSSAHRSGVPRAQRTSAATPRRPRR